MDLCSVPQLNSFLQRFPCVDQDSLVEIATCLYDIVRTVSIDDNDTTPNDFDSEQEEFKQLKWVCITVLVLGIVTCCVFAFINRVIPTPSTYKLLSENTSSNGVFGLFMLEMVLFTLSLASGELFVMNRHEPVTWKSIGATCALSALLHTVFQLNGFYSVTFKE